MRKITRTIYGADLQTSLLLDMPYTVDPHSTLNERFGIRADETLSEDEMPRVRYFCIGNRGHTMTVGSENIPYTLPLPHKATDAGLFGPFPFVLRRPANDLSVFQRERYALRKEIQVNGNNYIAYYLKRIDFSSVEKMKQILVKTDGEFQTSDFEPSEEHLRPTPPNANTDGPQTAMGSYLSISAIVEVLFDESDVAELVNVAKVLYDNEYKAVISEIGMCSGVDRVMETVGPSGSFNYNEAIAVQIVSHITGYYPLGFGNQGFKLEVEAGAVEPLYGDYSETDPEVEE